MQARGWQTSQAVWYDLEQARLVLDLSPANNLAKPGMGPALVQKATGRMKNLPTNMTCTRHRHVHHCPPAEYSTRICNSAQTSSGPYVAVSCSKPVLGRGFKRTPGMLQLASSNR